MIKVLEKDYLEMHSALHSLNSMMFACYQQ